VPTYQYACTDSACGHQFEKVQSVSDDPLTVCPQCEGRLRKVFSAVGVVFKGSGFYRTDSRAASNGSSADASNGASKGKAESGKDAPAAPSKTSSTSTSSESAASSSASSSTTSTSRAAAS
jgi:putative FmdB family regulatory protein